MSTTHSGSSVTTNPRSLWKAALGTLQMEVPKAQFATWLRNTHLVQADNGTFRIGVPTTFAKEVIERQFHPLIQRTLSDLCRQAVLIEYQVVEPPPEPEDSPTAPLVEPARVRTLLPSSPQLAGVARDATPASYFNPRYTFERFVVGAGNRLAHAAAVAVSERPAQAYNPLFIYGGVGLGKTHLLHAIGHHVQARLGHLQIMYVTCEQFTNEFIRAIATKRMDEFRDKYRSADVLLIDDVQFLTGKEQTQEEFFHTFNAYHEFGRQIVLSSDRPPKSIETLTDRLRSRFEWGLIADIQPPDLETRIAILWAKAQEEGAAVPEEVIEFLAHHIVSNIRELEGALTRLLAVASLEQRPLTQELAMDVLERLLFNVRKSAFTPEQILNAVATHYRVPMADLCGPKRDKAIAIPRQVAMYLIREETQLSLPEIGKLLGGRDHTTVMYGYGKIAKELERDDTLQRDVTGIRRLLQPAQ